ncbi:ATP-dependent DNA ligase [Actinoplanes sp. NBC_00393]|uniref:ATP-dependent DNA ligase n=1 Tax=Actinoplanes sp. NBC_00393 TaxID=2975953 RepID=UPI002E229FBE
MIKPPVEPMRAVPVSDLLEPRTHGTPQYEIKFDGWRCLAFTGERIHLQSRNLKPLTRYFPDVGAHLDAALLPDTVLDGELVVFDPSAGRTSFPALQARVTAGRRLAAEVAARPASYVVFDLLQFDGHELLDRPLLERRMLLEELLTGVPGLTVCPATRDPGEARRWFGDYTATGAEGLVIKDLSSRYRAKGRGWWKWRHRNTTEAIIGGVQGTLREPTALLLGRRAPDGRLHYVGHTVPLTAGQRADLAGLLTPAGPDHPWPCPLPAAWSGRFGRAGPLDYLPVQASHVAEVSVDEAYEHGRWRHPVRFMRLRPELQPSQVEPVSRAARR